MKAAITTFWETNDNYGSLLQNYALQKFLNLCGIETSLIRAKIGAEKTYAGMIKSVLKEDGILEFIKKLVFYIPKRFYYKSIAKNNLRRDFENFRINELNPTRIYSSIEDLKNDPPKADIYITGSDQVWNLFCASELYVNDFVDLYFLNFGNENIKRMACSVCICKNEIRLGFKEKLSQLIKKFEFVSTREEFGVDFCKSLGYENSYYQNDPSFLLTKDDYRNLYEADKFFLPKKKYVLLYLLNNKCDFSVSKLKRWAKKNNLDFVYVSGNENYVKYSSEKKFYATIPQWLELFDNAEYVFTNSFHGTVFSIIYNKKFLTIEQHGRWEYSNSRVYNLLDFFNARDRIFAGDFVEIENNINYDLINTKMNEIRIGSPFVGCVEKVRLQEINNVS